MTNINSNDHSLSRSTNDSSPISTSNTSDPEGEDPSQIATSKKDDTKSFCQKCWPPAVRLILVGLMLLGAFTTSLSKVNINTAIIAMSPQSHPPTTTTSSTTSAPEVSKVALKMIYGALNEEDLQNLSNFSSYNKNRKIKGKGWRHPQNPHHHYFRYYKVKLPFKEGEPYCGLYNGTGQLPPSVTLDGKNENGTQVSKSGSKQELEFNWSENQQDHLKGAFLIGYGLGLIPCGDASVQQAVGVKRMVAVGGLLHVTLNFLSPVGARFNYSLFFVFRVGLGLATAMLVPSFFTLIQRWVLDDEKSKVIASLKIGTSLGSIFLNYVAGHLIVHFGGWSAIFYLSGLLNIIWLTAWVFLASDTPADSALITEEERQKIDTNYKQRLIEKQEKEVQRSKSTSWYELYLAMLSSPTVLVTILAKLSGSLYESILQSKLPQYMIAVLGLDVGQTALWSSALNGVLFVALLVSGAMADYCINRRLLSRTRTRKLFETIASVGVFLSMLLLAETSSCHRGLFFILVSTSTAASAAATAGSGSIAVDMTTEFAGSLIALLSTAGVLFGYATPLLVSALTLHDRPQTPASWQFVFYLMAGIYAATGLIFLLHASAKSQERGWARKMTTSSSCCHDDNSKTTEEE